MEGHTFAINAAPLRDDHGGISAVLAVALDITERSQAEEALARRGAQLADAQRLAHLGSWEWDVTTDRVTWSDELYRIYGLDPAAFVPTYATSLEPIHPDDLPGLLRAIEATLRGGGPFVCEPRVVLPTGAVRRVQSRGLLEHDDAGRPARMVGSALDVTEAREAEAALRASEERFRRQYQELPTPAYTWRRDGDDFLLEDCNRAALATTNGTLAEHFGECLSRFYHDGPDMVADIRRAAAEQRTITRELRYQFSGTGQERDLVVRYVPIPPDIVMVYMEDVTERKDAERRHEQLARAEKLRALGQLAGGVAHDLNQSLSIILGYGELAAASLDESPPDIALLREALTLIVTAATDGGETVRRLLTFVGGHVEGNAVLVGVATLLAEVGRLTAPRWRDAAQAEGRPIALRVEAEGDLAILGWPSSLREALMNLVFNAVDAMPEGGEICLTSRGVGDRVEIAVVDTGAGMPSEVRERIFEPFFTTKGERGTGLGLPQVFGIVEQHDGRINVESAPGRGTTFRLGFPAARAADIPVTSSAALGHTLRILVIDDEPRIVAMAAMLLERDGHVVLSASSGEGAVEMLERETVDAVLTDLGMPGMGGWGVAAWVRDHRPGLPVVLATGWGAEIAPPTARERGVAEVLAKPYRLQELRHALAAVVPPREIR